MTTKTYELVVKTNQDVSNIHHLIGGYISTHVAKQESCEGGEYFSSEDIMAGYAHSTKATSPYHDWWNQHICFKGERNDKPYDSSSGAKSFHDANFESIIFSGHETEAQVRETIKAQFFKKFNVIVDKLDNSTLIEEVKVRIDSDAFNEQYSRKYCYKLLKEYEMHEKMFSGYVINKVEVASNTAVKRAITFYLDTAPDQEIIADMLARIRHFIHNYDQIMIETDMANIWYCDPLEELLENPTTFEIIGVDLIEHVTKSNTTKVF